MRTTLNLDDDVLLLAKAVAEARKITLGEAVSYLAKRGAMARMPLGERNGFHVFCLESGAPQFGPADIKAALEAEDRSRASSFWRPEG